MSISPDLRFLDGPEYFPKSAVMANPGGSIQTLTRMQDIYLSVGEVFFEELRIGASVRPCTVLSLQRMDLSGLPHGVYYEI